MTKEMTTEITEFINIVRQLNPASFTLIQHDAKLLLARDKTTEETVEQLVKQ